MARRWQRFLAACSLLAIPSVAIASFALPAWRALTVSPPHAAHVLGARPALLQEARAVVRPFNLRQWTDTAGGIPVTLIDQAHLESVALNVSVNSLRQLLAKLDVNSFEYLLTNQSLNLVVAERNAWDSAWRNIGAAHASQATIQKTLLTLQQLFVTGNNTLVVQQAQELQTGSAATFSVTGL